MVFEDNPAGDVADLLDPLRYSHDRCAISCSDLYSLKCW